MRKREMEGGAYGLRGREGQQVQIVIAVIDTSCDFGYAQVEALAISVSG
jgi:hypothetical protein